LRKKIKLLAPGPLKLDFVKIGLEYYSKKLKKFVDLDMLFPKVKTSGFNPEQRREREKEALKKYLKNKEYFFVLDEKGKTYRSFEFAKHLENLFLNYPCICFLIGGPEGISSELKSMAHEVISFSAFTLNHELVLLVLAEQLYRCFSIIKGTPYHRE